MVNIDMSTEATGGGHTEPGVYLARVQSPELAKAKTSGANMLVVQLVHDHGRKPICRDRIMLEGGGWGIGKAKLIALGVAEDYKGEIDPEFFRDKRVWVALKPDENPKYLTVDIDQLKHCGYQDVNDPPAGESVPEPDSDTPF